MRAIFLTLIFSACGQVVAQTSNPEVYRTRYVVAQDGSGDYPTIQQAIDACKHFPDKRIVIDLKPGIYKEKLEVYSWTTNISLIGENPETTIITYDDYSGKGTINTFRSYSVKVAGNGFLAENITFENTAGPVGQAVALHVEADKAQFINCRFLGNQDTIYTGGDSSRQYFLNCYIEGTTDFIFGAATVVFENCEIVSKKDSYVTAASTTQGKAFGYVFIKCNLKAIAGVSKVYLGRPWRNHAKTVFMNCELGTHILPEGWHNWSKPEAEQTAFYAEYKSKGPGANPHSRVHWARQLTDAEAKKYTVKNMLGDWVHSNH